jgi:hypothetical protein
MPPTVGLARAALFGGTDPARDIHPTAAATRAVTAALNRVLPHRAGAVRAPATLGVAVAGG